MPSENKDKKEEQEQSKKKNSDNNEKYHAKSKNNNGKRDKNKGNIPQQSSSPKDNQKNSNEKNNQDNNNQNDKKDAPKEDPKQHLKEQGAVAAMSALGVPAPLAQALAKPAVNKLSNQNNLLNEQQQMKQSQERLNNIRNIAGAMNESKKEKQEENGEEEQSLSLIDQAEDIKTKAENISGFIKFIKMIPAPAWGVIATIIGLFFFFWVFFSALNSSTVWASVIQDYLVDINPSNSDNNNSQSNPNQGTGKLGYPTDSRSISAGYPNYSSGAYHGGIDFPVSTGSNVYAAEAGEVIVKKQLNYSYGYYLYIKHDNGLCTLYAHNSELLVNEGDKVTKGQLIAKSGSTGNSTGPHCHFEVRTDCGVSGGSPSGTRVDPNNYLSE